MVLKDKRLKAIADMLPKSKVIADIGTDHGKLGCALLQNQKAETLWFTDISADSLKKAVELAHKLSLADRAAFFTGDGATVLPGTPDAAVIAGMGGKTICHILEEGKQILSSSVLILGPNIGAEDVRLWIMNNGFEITDEAAVVEAGRAYVLIKAEPGKSEYTHAQLVAGPILSQKKDEAAAEYFLFKYKIALNAFQNAAQSSNADTSALEKELEVWKKLQ